MVAAAENLISSRKYRKLQGANAPSKSLQICEIRDQALATMPELFKPMPDWSDKYANWYAELERHWKEQLALEREMQVTWDPLAERFMVGAKAK